MDLYKILGLDKKSNKKDIKKAYKKKAMETHPDLGGNEKDFVEITTAYMVLVDDDKRNRYDKTGQYDDNIKDEEADLKSSLCQLFLSIVMRGECKYRDIMTEMKTEINNKIKEGERQNKVLENKRKEFEIVKEKLEGKDKIYNLFISTIEGELSNISMTIEKNKELKNKFKKMEEMLKGIKYNFDKTIRDSEFNSMFINTFFEG